MSHPKCHTERGHVCQKPSGRKCYERGCDEPAGTGWGPMWCPKHDEERLDRITASLKSIVADFARGPVAETTP
jgi:hypothetical protein